MKFDIVGAEPDLRQLVYAALVNISGAEHVLCDEESVWKYGADMTGTFRFDFDFVVKPADPQQIAAIVNVCNRYGIPITPRGGGSGVTGGALPVRRGIVLSLERLNKVISIKGEDGYAMAESGVLTADLCEQVENAGYYFPVFPSSGGYSMLGGNVAENAGSINSCKYGNTSRYVLNLEVVLSSGAIIWTGSNVRKDATGFNLTQLFVGSEGLLGIITKVVYRIISKPVLQHSMLAGFTTLEGAINAVNAISSSALEPAAVELICENALHITADYFSGGLPLISAHIKAHLVLDFHEDHFFNMENALEQAATLLARFTAEDILLADSKSQRDKIWKLRLGIGAALTAKKRNYRDIDICVPLSALLAYIQEAESICNKYGITMACFGHALDGNLHTMLITENGTAGEWQLIQQAAKEIYSFAIELGGVISGEHGIGLLQKDFMKLQFSEDQLEVMHGIKKLLDPADILNPGKFL